MVEVRTALTSFLGCALLLLYVDLEWVYCTSLVHKLDLQVRQARFSVWYWSWSTLDVAITSCHLHWLVMSCRKDIVFILNLQIFLLASKPGKLSSSSILITHINQPCNIVCMFARHPTVFFFHSQKHNHKFFSEDIDITPLPPKQADKNFQHCVPSRKWLSHCRFSSKPGKFTNQLDTLNVQVQWSWLMPSLSYLCFSEFEKRKTIYHQDGISHSSPSETWLE